MSKILSTYGLMSLMEANKRLGYEDSEAFYKPLEKQHALLDVLPWLPANNGNFHEYSQVKSLGRGEWRHINEGLKPMVSTMENFTTAIKLYGGISRISKDVLTFADDPNKARISEEQMDARGIFHDFFDTVVNSDGSENIEGKKPLGFNYYRKNLGEYCIDNGGTADSGDSTHLTSLYLIQPGDSFVNIRYNTKLYGGEGIGLKIERGENLESWNDEAGNPVYGYTTQFNLSAGIEVRTASALIRLANINYTKAFDLTKIIELKHKLPDKGDGAVMIVPDVLYATFEKQAYNDTKNTLTYSDVQGWGKVLNLFGIPVLEEGAISINQSKVVEA